MMKLTSLVHTVAKHLSMVADKLGMVATGLKATAEAVTYAVNVYQALHAAKATGSAPMLPSASEAAEKSETVASASASEANTAATTGAGVDSTKAPSGVTKIHTRA